MKATMKVVAFYLYLVQKMKIFENVHYILISVIQSARL